MAIRQQADDAHQLTRQSELQTNSERLYPTFIVDPEDPGSGSSEENLSSVNRKHTSIVDRILQHAEENSRGSEVLDNHQFYLETSRPDLAEAGNGATHHVFLSTAEKQVELAPSTEQVWITNSNSTTPETIPASRSLIAHDSPDWRASNDRRVGNQRLRLETLVRRSRLRIYFRGKRKALALRLSTGRRPQY